MDETTPRMPRRRRKTKWEIIKEAYLPTIFMAITVVLIFVFIIGGLSRGSAPQEEPVVTTTVTPTEDPDLQYAAQAASLLSQAENFAKDYEYQKAIDLIDSFTGDFTAFPELTTARNEYQQALSEMVTWSDPSSVTVLSFHTLIVDTQRAFSDKDYAKSYNKNFVTIEEFSQILTSLYEKGYILVDLEDFTTCMENEDGSTICMSSPLQLPKDKKPLLLVQTNVNYYTYMVDGDGDGLPDKDGAGFASCLKVDEAGNIVAEYVTADGETVSGNYDLVPILNAFIKEHPDFSYRGARAILAPSGYDGIFGYRTNPSAESKLGADAYAEQISGAKKIVSALKAEGYTLACYTYGNKNYGNYTASQIQSDLRSWTAEVTPILGETNILVFAQNTEIAEYSGSKFNVLQSAGFRYFIGIGTANNSAAKVDSKYILLKRLNVTGSQMAHTSTFAHLFDSKAILDESRGNVPK